MSGKSRFAVILLRLPLMMLYTLLLPLWLIDFVPSRGKLFVNEIGLLLTSRCTLKCRHCISLMPYYDEDSSFTTDFSILKSDLEKLFNTVNYIGNIGILGGEPLLYAALADVIQLILDSGKVGSMTIITNGTIVPKDDLLQLVAANKQRISFTISKYPRELTPRIDEIIDKLKKHDIELYHMDVRWQNQYVRGLSSRGHSVEELKDIYRKCGTPCKSFMEGKLYACYVSAHGSKLGIVPCPEQDYADVRNPTAQTRRNIKRIFSGGKGYYIQACNYCDVMYEDRPEVPAAAQVPEDQLPLKP